MSIYHPILMRMKILLYLLNVIAFEGMIILGSYISTNVLLKVTKESKRKSLPRTNVIDAI